MMVRHFSIIMSFYENGEVAKNKNKNKITQNKKKQRVK